DVLILGVYVRVKRLRPQEYPGTRVEVIGEYRAGERLGEMHMGVDEAGRHAEAAPVDDAVESVPLMSRQNRIARPDIRDSVILDHDRGIANDRVARVDRQRKFEVFDQNSHEDTLRFRDTAKSAPPQMESANLDQLVGIGDIGQQTAAVGCDRDHILVLHPETVARIVDEWLDP